MPWQEVDAMSERLRFVQEARQRLGTFTELCARYGISRVTGYKWLDRANASGLDFLQERSRRPHTCPAARDAMWMLGAGLVVTVAGLVYIIRSPDD